MLSRLGGGWRGGRFSTCLFNVFAIDTAPTVNGLSLDVASSNTSRRSDGDRFVMSTAPINTGTYQYRFARPTWTRYKNISTGFKMVEGDFLVVR